MAAEAWPLLGTWRFSLEEALVLASKNRHLEADLHVERETHLAQAATTEGFSQRLWVVALRLYRLPGAHGEITDPVKELDRLDIICPTHSPFHSPVWPVCKSNGSWRTTLVYWELHKAVSPIQAAILISPNY